MARGLFLDPGWISTALAGVLRSLHHQGNPSIYFKWHRKSEKTKKFIRNLIKNEKHFSLIRANHCPKVNSSKKNFFLELLF